MNVMNGAQQLAVDGRKVEKHPRRLQKADN